LFRLSLTLSLLISAPISPPPPTPHPSAPELLSAIRAQHAQLDALAGCEPSTLFPGTYRALPPENEKQRLASLHDYRVLDQHDEVTQKLCDSMTQMISEICGTPIAVISLVDAERQWFKSVLGLPVKETHRDLAFCAHAIRDPTKMLIVNDAHTDVRFAGNGLVTSDPSIRFYAGTPLVTPNGYAALRVCLCICVYVYFFVSVYLCICACFCADCVQYCSVSQFSCFTMSAFRLTKC
jgi:GAF domain-containing protein